MRPDATDTIRNESCWSRRCRRTCGRSQATATARTANSTRPRIVVSKGRPSRSDDGEQDGRDGHADDVLDHAPAEQRVLGRPVGRAAAAARDVDDHDGRRERDAEAQRRGRRRGDSADQGRGPGNGGGDEDLEGRRDEEAALFAPDSHDIHLDADLEEQEDDSQVGEQLDLVAIGDVPGRERRDHDAKQEVPDHRRQPDATGKPTEARRGEQDEADLEDRRGRFHPGILGEGAGLAGGEPRHARLRGRPMGARIARLELLAMPVTPQRLWRSPEPKHAYDTIIVGAGGHGLATAYYLAKNHGITDVAVLERGILGLGNMGRNTTIIRSNYLWDASAGIYEFSLKLWEGLEAELDFDVLLSQRGVVNLAHSLGDIREGQRRVAANHVNGVDAEWLSPAEIHDLCPIVNVSPEVRYPILGGTYQARGGVARHDRVAWGYARGADALGVDVVQGCEVTGISVADGRVAGVETTLGPIRANRVALAAAGHTTVLADMVGIRLPIQSHPLQALVSELMEPVLDKVIMSNAVHVYVSQADKGELVMGAGIDAYNSYAQRGSVAIIERQIAAALELFPIFSRVHMLRTWAGIVDVAPDASPIIAPLPIDGLFVNTGWGTGGFKATPGSGWVYAHTIATGAPHVLNAPFSLDRFTRGVLVDEHGAAAVAH